MKKYIYIFAAMVFASCANDEVVDSSATDASQITFDVTTNNATRATELHSSANNSFDFIVSAVLADGKAQTNNYVPYFENMWAEVCQHTDKTAYWTLHESVSSSDATTRYWPQTYGLNFYAFHGKTNVSSTNTDVSANSALAYANNKVSLNVSNLTVGNPESQDDWLYAYKQGATKGTDGKATLNFRHALSQIEFRAKCATKSILVDIESISICGINKSGNLSIGAAETGTQYTTDGTWSESYPTACTWTVTDDATKTANVLTTTVKNTIWYGYLVHNYQKTGDSDVMTFDTSNTFMSLPQSIATNGTSNAAKVNGTWQGVYIKLSCRVLNITDTDAYASLVAKLQAEFAKTQGISIEEAMEQLVDYGEVSLSENTVTVGESGVYQGEAVIGKLENKDGTSEYADLYIPFDVVSTGAINQWDAGKKYVYTLVFGTGSNIAQDSDGNPVLVPITVEATIDDWAVQGDVEVTP